MTRFPIIFLLLMMLNDGSTLSAEDHQQEAHSILKRMAEANEHFEGYDVAQIFTTGSQRPKRLVKRDTAQTGGMFSRRDLSSLNLHLSSGSKVKLALVPARILDPDTIVSYETREGRTERRWEGGNCFSHGHFEDSSGGGPAAISHCNGIFGFAKTPSYDYLVYPIQTTRHKRDTGEGYDVHLMWRRSEAATNESGSVTSSPEAIEDPIMPIDDIVPEEFSNDTTTSQPSYEKVVIEMALFADEKYWFKLHRAYRDRVDEYMMTLVAGTQALFGNPERVGYDIQIKVKLLEYWKTNPEGYDFQDSTPNNLRSFCKYTTKKYRYDVHALHSGIWKYEKGLVGLAYVGQTCKAKRCFVKKTFGIDSFSLLAHELGHSLGMPHQSRANCPKDEPYFGGFMGGGRIYNFSPCMKHYLSKFLESRKSNCLFNESVNTVSPLQGIELPRMFPAQIKSPDELCQLLAGPDFRYVPLTKSLGNSICHWMVCYNENKTSDAFGKAKRIIAPAGFPCDHEGICVKENKCDLWTKTQTVFNLESLREMTRIPEWSEWSTLSDCSRSCGTGVRTRRRECVYTGYNLALYCPGAAVKAELCNTDPCPGDPTNKGELRRVRGDEICARFLRNNVTLNLRKANGYLSTCNNVTKSDILKPANINDIHSRSCLMKCDRDPVNRKGTVDALMPDGAPCYDTNRWERELVSLNIDLICVRGSCLEFTDCPVEYQSKDECGICGGDGSRCVSLSFDSSYDVPRGVRSNLATIPAGSTNIKVRMDRKKNKGVILEMWSYDDRSIIGKAGLFSNRYYEGSNAVQHAGAEWFYSHEGSYIHAPGPTQESVKIKALRQNYPIKMITIQYAKSQGA